MTRAVLRLKRGREARARSHPWIFKGDVADVTDVAPGSAVAVVDAAGRFVGRGFYNPRPALCCRLLPGADEPLDEAFFRRRLGEALALRARGPAGLPPLGRLVWSEADGLPGLVVDRYGPALVVQCLTLGMARCRPLVLDGLAAPADGVPPLARDQLAPGAARGLRARPRRGPRRGARERRGRGGRRPVPGDARRRAQDGALPGPAREPRARRRPGGRPRRARRLLPRGRLRLSCARGRRPPHRAARVLPRGARGRAREPGAQRRRRPGGGRRGQRLRRAQAPGARRRPLRPLRARPAALRSEPERPRGRAPGLQGDQPPGDAAARAGRASPDLLLLLPRLRGALRGGLPRGGCRRRRAPAPARPARPGAGPSRPAHRARDALPEGPAPRGRLTRPAEESPPKLSSPSVSCCRSSGGQVLPDFHLTSPIINWRAQQGRRPPPWHP